MSHGRQFLCLFACLLFIVISLPSGLTWSACLTEIHPSNKGKGGQEKEGKLTNNLTLGSVQLPFGSKDEVEKFSANTVSFPP